MVLAMGISFEVLWASTGRLGSIVDSWILQVWGARNLKT